VAQAEGLVVGSDNLVCWNCGAAFTDQPLPLSRLAVCAKCRAYLHVCRLCCSYDPKLTRRCREPDAEEVTDHERANFCSYFRARTGAFRSGGDARIQIARAKLGELFGGGDKTSQEPEL
jgi:hypothetical protein